MCSVSSLDVRCRYKDHFLYFGRNLRAVFDNASVFGKLSVNEFKIVCDQLQLKISTEGCSSLFEEWFYSCDKKIVFHEFCLIVACYLLTERSVSQHKDYNCEVFLGGACNPTTWRVDAAIPFLENAGISYYNPQVPSWSPELVEIETKAKASSYVLLYVFELWKTRAVSSFVEVAYLAAKKRNVVLVLTEHSLAEPLVIAGEQVLPSEKACLQQAREYMCNFADRLGVPLFFKLSEALEYVKTSVFAHRDLMKKRSRRKFMSIPSAEQQLIDRVLLVRNVFNSLKPSKLGAVGIEQARCGLQYLQANFPCHSAFREHKLKTLNFEQFSMAFACYVFQHSKTEPFSSSETSLQDSENVSSPLQTGAGFLRHTRSLYSRRECDLAQRALKPLKSYGSFDQSVDEKPLTESPRRRRRLPLSASLDDQADLLTNTSSSNRQLNAFKSWINGFRKRRVLSPSPFPDEPDCLFTYDLYVCGSKSDNLSISEQNIVSSLRPSATGLPFSVFFADNPPHEPGASISPTDTEHLRVWARNHSRLLLYVISSHSFNLSKMMEAALAIGSGLPVVLCVEKLLTNDATEQVDGEKRLTQLLSSSSGARELSGRTDLVPMGKRVRSDRRVESLEFSRIKTGSARSSMSSLSSSWTKQTSPNDEITGFPLSDGIINGGESNSGSVTTSPLCPGVRSVLNPSMDSGIGLTSESTELFEEPTEMDGVACGVANSSHRDKASGDKSASLSPALEKSILPDVWEDCVLSFDVSSSAAKDHNRGRVYLTSIAQEMHIPVTNQIQEALNWCRTRLNTFSSSSSSS